MIGDVILSLQSTAKAALRGAVAAGNRGETQAIESLQSLPLKGTF